jgi:hypothetical protein
MVRGFFSQKDGFSAPEKVPRCIMHDGVTQQAARASHGRVLDLSTAQVHVAIAVVFLIWLAVKMNAN